MGKLLDAELLLADLRDRKSNTYWGADTEDPFARGVVYDMEYYITQVNDGRYDAPGELQPRPPRQPLVEALEAAEVGTRFWFPKTNGTVPNDVPIIVAPGKMYHDGRVRTVAEHYKGYSFYADQFTIERPTY